MKYVSDINEPNDENYNYIKEQLNYIIEYGKTNEKIIIIGRTINTLFL